MFTVELKETGTIAQKAKQFPHVVLAVMAEAMLGWQKNTMPRHFAPNAFYRYGYQPRTAKYLKEKKRRSQYATNPLMFTGRSQRQLGVPLRIAFQKGKIRGSFITNNTMRYFWMTASKKSGKQPNKPDELMRLGADEVRQINAFIQNEVIRRLGEINDHKKTA